MCVCGTLFEEIMGATDSDPAACLELAKMACASRMLASAQTDAEQSIKTTKQQCHRQWRESVANAEREAEARAKDILINGEKEAKTFYESKKGSVDEVANWLVREVTATYGSCRDV